MNKIRFGIIGTNFISGKFVEALYEFEDCVIDSIYTRQKENVQKLNISLDDIQVFTDFECFAEAGSFDAVYVASPNVFHFEQSIALMKQGKHVLCEKPLASNEKQVQLMIDCAKEHQVVLLEAMRPLHHPTTQIIKQALKDIGPIHIAEIKYCQYSSRYDAFKAGHVSNAFNPEFSNGSVMDIGIYPIEMMLHLFGNPSFVHCFGKVLPGSIDGYGHLVADYPSMICSVSYSKISNNYTPSEIQGEKGSLLFDKVACASKVWIQWKDETSTILYDQQNYNDLINEIECLVDAINKKNDLTYFQQISLNGLQITDAVRKQLGIAFSADGSLYGQWSSEIRS